MLFKLTCNFLKVIASLKIYCYEHFFKVSKASIEQSEPWEKIQAEIIVFVVGKPKI